MNEIRSDPRATTSAAQETQPRAAQLRVRKDEVASQESSAGLLCECQELSDLSSHCGLAAWEARASSQHLGLASQLAVSPPGPKASSTNLHLWT